MWRKINIIYEDDHLLVVNKPPLLLSIPDRYSPDKPNLKYFLQKQYDKVLTVHRLDKETSGVICFAKDERTHRELSLQFEKRQVQKSYLAIVDGQVGEDEKTIEKPIAHGSSGSGKMVISSKGKSSLTTLKVLERFPQFTLLEIQIHTGRTHQIRVHLESIGYPLAVDRLYGRRSELFLSSIKLKRYKLGKGQEERPLISRCPLHAHSLTINHPSTKEKMTFEAPLPKDMKALLNQLRK